jgi:hypothetical protein
MPARTVAMRRRDSSAMSHRDSPERGFVRSGPRALQFGQGEVFVQRAATVGWCRAKKFADGAPVGAGGRMKRPKKRQAIRFPREMDT